MKIHSLFVVLSLAAASLPACSGAVSTQSACGDFAKAECNKLAQCAATTMQELFAGDLTACESSYTGSCTASVSFKGSAITPGWLEGCVGALNAESCAEASQKDPSQCVVPAGTLADGAACSEEFQCKGGVCTVSGTTTTSVACGVCTEKPASAGCTSSDDCPGDQICNFNDATGAVTGQCAEPLGAGASCSAGASLCGSGLFCQSSTTTGALTCAPLPTAGQPCPDFDCASGLVCGASGTCQSPAFVALGGKCGADSICAGGNCINLTCVAYPAIGSACATTGLPCAIGGTCVNGKCVSLDALDTCN